jgi:hypothetical protein
LDRRAGETDREVLHTGALVILDLPMDELTAVLFEHGYIPLLGVTWRRLDSRRSSVRDYDIRQQNPGQPWKYTAYFTTVPYGWPCYISIREKMVFARGAGVAL